MADRDPDRPYEQVLSDAVRVMTEAARLTWSRTDGDGGSVVVHTDWAEFVALALAGAAANAGGIENVLAGRPGSWEADHVRQLLVSTVGHDEQQLPDHRTEPVVVDVFVDEIMVDLGMWKAYDNAQQELTRRYADLASATLAEQAQEPRALAVAQEQQLDQLADLEERLEAQRLQDWAEYGQALKTGIEAAAGRRPGLRVPVVVNLDVETFRADGGDPGSGLEGQLLQEAIMSTPLPGNTVPLQDDPDPLLLGRLSRLTTPEPAPEAGAPAVEQQQP
jgi:hypothetical protein